MLLSLIFLKNFIRGKKNAFLKKIKKLEVLQKKSKSQVRKVISFSLSFVYSFRKKYNNALYLLTVISTRKNGTKHFHETPRTDKLLDYHMEHLYYNHSYFLDYFIKFLTNKLKL